MTEIIETNPVDDEQDNLDFAGQSERQKKISILLKSIAQDFFQRESSGASLITITNAKITKDLKRADIFITVFPENKEEHALSFAKRMRNDLRTELKKKLKIRTIPVVDVQIDKGEKIRQKMDEVLRENKNH